MDGELIDLNYVGNLAINASGAKKVDGYEPFFLVPDGDGKFHVHTALRSDQIPLPDHIIQEVSLHTLESFIGYVKQFKTLSTAIFAALSGDGAKFGAVLDYHNASESKPRRGKHRADYVPGYSPEWKAWSGIAMKPLTQDDFLEHIRRWGYVITNQSDADLIELASNLDFTIAGKVSSSVQRVTGGRKLTVNEDVTAGANGKQVTVPDRLSLKLPVFFEGKEWAIDADLLYRPQGGQLRILVDLLRPHVVKRAAIMSIVGDIKEGTGINPFLGTPNL